MKQLIQAWDFWEERVKPIWHTFSGLIIGLTLGIFAAQLIYQALFDVLGSTKTKPYFFIITHLVVGLLVILFWILSRRLPIFTESQIGILFALPHDNLTMKKEIKQIWQNLQAVIKEKRFVEDFDIKKITLNHMPSDHDAASQILRQSQGTLMVWGRMMEGKVEGNNRLIPTVSFTWLHPRLSREQQEQLIKDVAIGFPERVWSIDEENSLEGISNVTNHILEISLYIIGITQILYQKYNLAMKTFSILMPELEKPSKEKGPFRKLLQQKTKFFFGISIESYLIDIGFNYEDKTNLAKVELVRANIETIKNLLPQSSLPYTFEGVIAVHEGDINKAKERIGVAKSKSKKDPAAYYSMAFLFFISDKFQNGYKEYHTAFQKIFVPRTVFQVLDFTEKYLRDHPERIELHFALGLINIELLDKEVGIVEITTFLEKAQKIEKYKFLVKKAKKLGER